MAVRILMHLFELSRRLSANATLQVDSGEISQAEAAE